MASTTNRLLAVALALALGACATFSEDGGFGAVQQVTKERLGQDAKWQRSDADREAVARIVREKLAAPLTAEDAVQIALINNPGLQATYAELGIVEADVVAAGRLPSIHIASLKTKYGGETVKVEQAIGIGVVELLTLPLRYRFESTRFELAQAEVARQTLAIAHETRRAWFDAVAAIETERYMELVKESAEASAELARRMARAGNFSKLQQMEEQVFYAEATAQLARARQATVAVREGLTRLMGLSGAEASYRLPDRLPDPPAQAPEYRDVQSTALEERLDIRAARRDAASLAQSLGLVKTTRFINALEIGRARTKEGQEPFAYGWEFAVSIPLFDFGTARVARAEALYMQSVNRVAETAVNAESEVREAYTAYRTAYDTARHYRTEIVPLRKKISEEKLLRYNGMLISVFELLADARDQISAVTAAINTSREFWLAETDLQSALTGAGVGPRIAGRPSPLPIGRQGAAPH